MQAAEVLTGPSGAAPWDFEAHCRALDRGFSLIICKRVMVLYSLHYDEGGAKPFMKLQASHGHVGEGHIHTTLLDCNSPNQH